MASGTSNPTSSAQIIIPAITAIVVAAITTWGTIEVKRKEIGTASKDLKEAQSAAKTAQKDAQNAAKAPDLQLSGGTITVSANNTIGVQSRTGRPFTLALEPGGKEIRITFEKAFQDKPIVLAVYTDRRGGYIRGEAPDNKTVVVRFFDYQGQPMDAARDFTFVALQTAEEK